VAEEDRGGLQRAPSWSLGTGLKEPTALTVTAPAAVTAGGGHRGRRSPRGRSPRAAVEDMRERRVDDLPFVEEAGLLHHSLRGHVARERERDDLAQPDMAEPSLDRRERELGRQPITP